MNPLRIQAATYGPFGDLDIELPLGATAVLGPNGSGKSFLVNAVDRALFGSRHMDEWLTTGADEAEMSLCLEFESGGQLYRVRRSYSARGRGKPALDFEQHAENFDPFEETPNPRGAYWTPRTRESMKETQALLEQTLGFTRATFRASAFRDQDGAGSFTNPGLDARHRKEIFFDLLGLTVYDALLEAARRRLNVASHEIAGLQSQIEQAETELEKQTMLQSQETNLLQQLGSDESALTVVETAHRTATEALAASRETAAKLGAAREVLVVRDRELAEIVTRRRVIEQALTEAEGLPAQKVEYEQKAEPIPYLEAELDSARAEVEARQDHERLFLEWNRLLGEASELNEKAQALRDEAKLLKENGPDATTCDRCRQTLGVEALRATLEAMRGEADTLDTQAAAKDQAAGEIPVEAASKRLEAIASARPITEIETALREARAAQSYIAEITVRLERVESQKAELADLAERHPLLESAKADAANEVRQLEADAPTEGLEEKVARAYGVLVEARNACEATRQSIALVKAELERLGRIEAQAAENRKAISERQSAVDVLKLAERACGRDGIPALILENVAIPLMEVKANEALARLGGKTASARIELRTQRALKSGDGLADTLEIVVCTAEGFERSYGNWSGGEQMRIEIALRLGLMALSGAEIGILILDEPGNLDEAGKGDLIELLGSVLAFGIERVLLVSHDPDLRDAFDSTIEVVPVDETRSRIETGEREAIAA